MEEFFTLAIEVLKVHILPLFDFLYIGIVLSGATLLLKLFPYLGKTKRSKFISVFLFASAISLLHAYWHKDIEGFEYMLARSFFNYSLAILIYHAVIKTIAKAWDSFLKKTFGG